MFKKLSLIGVLCIGLIAIWGTHANAWFVPSPPGVSGWGCCSYAAITTWIAGGGPVDKNGTIIDGQTSLFVSIFIKEGYIVLYNPNNSGKNQEKKVTVGIGGHIPVLARSPLYGTLPDENGSGYPVQVYVPVDVDQCHKGSGGDDPIFFPLCENPPGYPTGTLTYLTEQEDEEARFLFYWHIIRPEEGAPPLTAAEVAEQYFAFMKNGWHLESLRIILAEVYAYLDGKWAQGDPSPEVNVLTNENYRATDWPDPDDPWDGGDIITPIYWVIRGQGEPFAFYDHVEAFGGTARERRARDGVLSNDVDLEDDQLQVIAVGPAEDFTDSANVGVETLTAKGGTITLKANGTFTYTAPEDNSNVMHDYAWYKNGEKYGPNESNVTVIHFEIIY